MRVSNTKSRRLVINKTYKRKQHRKSKTYYMTGGVLLPLLGGGILFGLGVCIRLCISEFIRRDRDKKKFVIAAAASAAAAEVIRLNEEKKRDAAAAAAKTKADAAAAAAAAAKTKADAAAAAARQQPPPAPTTGCVPVPGSVKQVYFCRNYTENEIETIARACAATVKSVVEQIIQVTPNNNNVTDEAMLTSFLLLRQHLDNNPVQNKKVGGANLKNPDNIGKAASNIVLAAIRSHNEGEVRSSVIKEAKNLGLDSSEANMFAAMAVNEIA